MKAIWNFILRVLAVFLMSALSTIGAGAILQMDIYKTALLAGLVGIARVVEGITREFLDDGKLTMDEVNEMFNSLAEKNKENS